ncbi:MAG: diacylglycerol kinase family protein [Thermaerobacterales bacterium]
MKTGRTLPQAFIYAWRGFIYTWRTQPNMRIHFAAGITVAAAGRWVGLLAVETAVVWLAVGLVICVEALNTAVETAVDLASRERHPLARRAKDVAAGAVLWAVVVAVAVGIWVFGPHLAGLPAVLRHQWLTAPWQIGAVLFSVAALLFSGLRR